MKFYLLSPEKIPMNQILFPSFIKPFQDKGHSFVDSVGECDVVLFDLHARISDYKQEDIDWITEHNVPIAVFDEYDRGNMSLDIWPNPLTDQQKQIFERIDSGEIKAVHFCRLMDKTHRYPDNIFPYEKGILYEEPACSEDELFNREFDICFIANSAPSRERIAQALLEDGRLKCNISIGAKKIPFDEFVGEHKKAKLFISSGAGGATDERCQALFSISAIIRERTNQVLLNDFTHLGNCLRISNPPTAEDLDTICEIVNDKEKLYKIYLNGYNFMKTYFTPDYFANHVLNIIEKTLFV